jgi:hypothetical protein
VKKLVLSLSLLALVCFATAVIAAPATTPEPAPQETEAVPVETAPEVVEVEATIPALCEVGTSMFPNPNYCGDPCSNEGAMVGCIDTSGGVARRTICTCSGGYLVC